MAAKAAGKSLVLKREPGVHQVTPTADPVTGLIECNWTDPFRINVPSSWLSGIYLVKLHGNTSGKESYITFTVRDARDAAIVFQQSVTTYQAYNPWPGWDPAGGYVGASLYSYSTNGNIPSGSVGTDNQGQVYSGVIQSALRTRATGNYALWRWCWRFSYPRLRLDFLALMPRSLIATGGASAWEFAMVRWLEHHAYDVTYITNVDTHEDVNRLLRGKAFLSIGHDEYWTEQMKTNAFCGAKSGSQPWILFRQLRLLAGLTAA